MTVKFGIQLPDWYDRKLRLWAKLKGVPRATLAANVLQARIEANWNDVEKELEDIATREGTTRTQLEAEWLNGGEEED
jgi:hypothetical protein